jgi:hypothetical protein
LLDVPQSEDPEAGLIWPTQVTLAFASETDPEAGVAPREIGIFTMTIATAATKNNAASTNLNFLIVEIALESASFVNISESPFLIEPLSSAVIHFKEKELSRSFPLSSIQLLQYRYDFGQRIER